jgi:NTP pyrophosphatase (non-canonical NTP hydrolase)
MLKLIKKIYKRLRRRIAIRKLRNNPELHQAIKDKLEEEKRYVKVNISAGKHKSLTIQVVPDELEGKINTIYNTYGLKTQKTKLIEELAELIKEIAKNDGENLAKELADVYIVATGILNNNPELKEIFKKEVEFKVNRQIERINNPLTS